MKNEIGQDNIFQYFDYNMNYGHWIEMILETLQN